MIHYAVPRPQHVSGFCLFANHSPGNQDDKDAVFVYDPPKLKNMEVQFLKFPEENQELPEGLLCSCACFQPAHLKFDQFHLHLHPDFSDCSGNYAGYGLYAERRMSGQMMAWNVMWTKLKILVLDHSDLQQIRYALYRTN